MFPELQELPLHTPHVTFVTSQELEDLLPYPDPRRNGRTPSVQANGTTFLMQIGAALESGQPHDSRAPDYDDWTLNGDLLFWNDPLGSAAMKLSSMGIRVHAKSHGPATWWAADAPPAAVCRSTRQCWPVTLPLTLIGGGIGQSRPAHAAAGQGVHIGEVQASVWDAATLEACRQAGIPLL